MKEINQKFSGDDPRLEGAEKYILPEDFKEHSPWRMIIEAYGPGPVLMLAWLCGGDKRYIPRYETFTCKGSMRRRRENRRRRMRGSS